MSSTKEIARVNNRMMPFDISILNDPAAVASGNGTITDINQAFTNAFGWTKEELVGQNCHLLIPSKFVRKTAHDRKLKGYTFGKESPIMGKSRIVPVATPEDGEVLVQIKIIPIKYKKEFCFMSLYDKIDFNRRFYNFSTEFRELREKIKGTVSTKEEFREDDIGPSLIVKDVARLFAKEFEVIGDFIVENCHSPSVLVMSKYFLITQPIGNLEYLQKEMEKTFDNNNISYLNICCLRIIFPSILQRVEMPFINELKQSLYADVSVSESES